MGLLKNYKEALNNQTFEKIQDNLHVKDGKVHVLMMTSFSKIANQNYDVETKYTAEIGCVVDYIQEHDYEIVDIKVSTLADQGLTGQRTGFSTLIMYK